MVHMSSRHMMNGHYSIACVKSVGERICLLIMCDDHISRTVADRKKETIMKLVENLMKNILVAKSVR